MAKSCFKSAAIAFVTAVLTFAYPASAYATISESELHFYGQNNILYFDPTASQCTKAATTSGNSDGSDVFVIGDSISTDTYAGRAIKSALPNAEIKAIGSTWFSNPVQPTSGVERVIENIDEIERRGILVFAMGTNGGVNYNVKDDTDKLFAALAGRNVKVILMTIFYADHFSDAQMEESNRQVKQIANAYSNVSVMDWYSVASANPEKYITKDAVHAHPTPEGAEKFASVMKDAINKVTKKVGAGSTSETSGGGYARLKNAVREYGEFAMQMQLEYGTPWDVVLAQMQHESGVGTAGIAVSGADNNWLGITGSGDAGYWLSSSGRSWAKFSSVEKSIEAWAGTKVLRNGYYDDAFPYLDPDNWDMETFLVKMTSHYAPSSDGNNESAYVASVLSLLRGPIREVQEEMGWLSSEDFAKQNSIPVGGNHPIGQTIDTSDSSARTMYASSFCNSNASAEGVTVTSLDGLDWAFPLAGATKANYLANNNDNLKQYRANCGGYDCVSVLSQPPNWYHHCEREGGSDCGYKVDLGIMQQLVDGRQRTPEEYNRRYGTTAIKGDALLFYSTGATVVAMASGTVSSVSPYMGMSYCKQVSIKSDAGYPYQKLYYTHMSMDDTVSVGQHVNAGDPIGEVGPPNCTGNGSQGHVHVDTRHYGDNIHPLLQALYDVLPEE